MGSDTWSTTFATPDGGEHTAYITLSWDNNYYVTVTSIWCDSGLDDGSWTWRITGRYSEGDQEWYAQEGKYGFQGEGNGKTYVFGASAANNNVSTGNWTNSGNCYITLSSGSSGGDSGDTGGGSGQACLVYISTGNGTNVEVIDVNGDYVSNMGTVYSGDYIAVKCTANSGYTLSSFNVTGATYAYDYDGYKVYTVTSNVYISATAVQSGGSGGNAGDSNSSVYPESGTQNGVTATLTISGSTVTVKVSSTSLPWRINGTNSGGDHETYYIKENMSSSGSFTAEDGHAYAFQVASGGIWSDGFIFYTNIGSGGGSSGGDDSGDSGGSGSGVTHTGNVAAGFLYSGGSSCVASANVSWNNDLIVTISNVRYSYASGSSIPASCKWRVRENYNGSPILAGYTDTDFLGYTFQADNNTQYVFQACVSGPYQWGNSLIPEGQSGSSYFTVKYIENGGSDGGEVVDSYTLHFNEGEGISLTVIRTSSTYGVMGIMYANGDIYYNDIWENDRFEIVVEAQEGYQLNELVVDGLQYVNGTYIFNGNRNASITASATLVATIRIYSKNISSENTYSWNTYAPFIYDGSNWNRYRPYIYNSSNSSWDKYS